VLDPYGDLVEGTADLLNGDRTWRSEHGTLPEVTLVGVPYLR
jgi:hypothetical protein